MKTNTPAGSAHYALENGELVKYTARQNNGLCVPFLESVKDGETRIISADVIPAIEIFEIQL